MLSAASARCIGHSHCRLRLDVCADADGTQYMHVQCTTFRLQLMSGASSTLTASAACVRAASCMYVYRAVSELCGHVQLYVAPALAFAWFKLASLRGVARTYPCPASFIGQGPDAHGQRQRSRQGHSGAAVVPPHPCGCERRSGVGWGPCWGLRLVRRRSSFYRPYNGYSNRHLDRCTQRN